MERLNAQEAKAMAEQNKERYEEDIEKIVVYVLGRIKEQAKAGRFSLKQIFYGLPDAARNIPFPDPTLQKKVMNILTKLDYVVECADNYDPETNPFPVSARW
jgi:hypothetical protein